jgi:phosphomannomutase
LLAESLLRRNPGGKVVHDPRLTWNTLDIVAAAKGEAVKSKSGHSFIKEKMRSVDAVYGGEMSAHHYFREFSYADSGMIPWLLIAELISTSGISLSEMVGERIAKYPASGEINRRVTDAAKAIEAIGNEYIPNAVDVDKTDGISIELEDWRFNLRASNTEPVIRLNVEGRGNEALMHQKTQELLSHLEQFAQD